MKLIIYFLFLAAVFAEERLYTVAFAQDTLANDFRKAQVLEALDEAKKYRDINFVYSDGKASTALFIAQIEEFILSRVDILIISSGDEQAVVPAVEKAYEKGIPVILLDRGVKSDKYRLYIHPDNALIARKIGKYMVQKLHRHGTILMLKGIAKADVTHLRRDAFLKAVAPYKEIKVIEREANFLRKDAIGVAEALLKEGIAYDAIYSQSDSMLSGVRMVFKKYAIDPSSKVCVGTDYIKESQDAILKGEQDSSFVYALGGKEAIYWARQIIMEKKVPKEIILETQQVTRANAKFVKPIF